MGVHTGLIILLLVCLVKANYSPTVSAGVHNLCEDLKPGEFAFDIKASDVEGDTLTFRLSEADAAYFRVNATNGSVTVNAALDREEKNRLSFLAHASDGTSEGSGRITVLLLDVNDNRPLFQNPPYDETVKENAPVGKSLFTVEAEDRDTGDAGAVRYRITDVTPNQGSGLFEIGHYDGVVRLTGRLDYTLYTFYRLTINASDGGGSCGSGSFEVQSNSVFGYITVEDVPDLDPVFINIPYTGSVEENEPVGTSVFKVSALDQDTGVNDVMIYSIEASEPPGLFQISSGEGVISILSNIDREATGDTVTLTVKATETNANIHGTHSSVTTTVRINIIDVNDNPPEFYNCEESCVKATEFTGKVVENYVGFISFNMMVKDLDKTTNTKLTLDGVDKDVFSVEPSTTTSNSTVQLRVKQPENLDFEQKQQMILRVIAEDIDETTFHSTATVTINIQDANDNSPTFPENTYELNVPEHSPAGTNLTQITAEDPDTMDEGKITYKLFPESILAFFDVDPKSGRIYVKDGSLLDREVRSLYTATLQARDTENKPGSTVLEITLTDINDNAPVFNRPFYQEFAKEGDDFVYTVEATDRDELGTVNSEILFSIKPGSYSNNFTIDEKKGELKNKGSLDLEALDPELGGKIVLNIVATDEGTPAMSSTIPFTITLQDVNDNAPKFKKSSYAFTVKEGEKGAFVGSVEAEDLDQTSDFNRISFTIVNGGFGSFSIKAFEADKGYSGKISVDQDIELDYEAAPNEFDLQVEATDREQEKDLVIVKVTVLDVNDERPEFLPTDPVSIKENSKPTESIGQFIGKDKDTNSSLIYQQESVNCRCKDTMKLCNWFILEPTGKVYVNPDITVDYEQCDQGVVEAQVVDRYTEKGENNSVKTGKMVINIEDTNDNAPEFIPSDAAFVVVSDGASIATSVAKVTATDKDSGQNRVITFKVKEVKFDHEDGSIQDFRLLFEAITTQQNDIFVGLIQTTESLDVTLKGTYLVTVTANDTGGLESSTVVEIFTVDEGYKVELEFKLSEFEFKNKQTEIERSLMAATSAEIRIVRIKSKSGGPSRNAEEQTVIVAYFVYRNGSALSSTEVEDKLSVPEHFVILSELGLSTIGMSVPEKKTNNTVQFVLVGMVGGLVIVLVVLITSLMCTRRNYRRKLKAAEAMNTASMMNSDNQKGGAVVPGTNKYTMEGANPVLNLHIDTTVALDLDGESSDLDKVSINSLDDNYDMTGNNSKLDMERIDEEEEDSDGPPEYDEPLSAALAQLGPKKTPNTSNIGFTNPIFDTTDL
ncbi:cadherin-related family member 2 [Kryptolebias marmoratus]|uniref:Cadherin domain-containing protein n=1 Tax=Kryptolebias marmoratus TaxID=37003 RepID=A0A3Q3A6I9_KRYMA|nr:cadherin-related family member 2 [Kryptolebias marmoratus]